MNLQTKLATQDQEKLLLVFKLGVALGKQGLTETQALRELEKALTPQTDIFELVDSYLESSVG
jgi:hypothetical protein